MPKHGKKYQDAVKRVDKDNLYEVAEALKLVKENATAKFDESVEVKPGSHLLAGPHTC